MIAVFKEMLDDRDTRAISSELRWLARVLGPARQLQVFEDRMIAVFRRSGLSDGPLDALAAEIAKRRAASAQRSRDAIESSRYRRLLLETAEWIDAGAWLSSLDAVRKAARAEPIRSFASRALSSLAKKLMRRGFTLGAMDADRRLKVKTTAKKLRYAIEAFESVFKGKRVNRRRPGFIAALKDLQRALGNLDDVTANGEPPGSIAQQEPAVSRSVPRQRANIGGIAAGDEAAHQAALVRASVRAYWRLVEAPRFWG
jgi:CHAD domain-containing protein